MAADLDRIAALAAQTPFDVSPRGLTPRPDPQLQALLADVGPGDVDGLAVRLAAARDPSTALVLGGALARLHTPEAEQALDEYAARLREHEPWEGARSVLTYLGR